MSEKKSKPKRKHLHKIISTMAHDGSVTHHHVYKSDPNDPHEEPERLAATSSNAEDAGMHVADSFGQNGTADPGEVTGEGEPAAPEDDQTGQE